MNGFAVAAGGFSPWASIASCRGGVRDVKMSTIIRNFFEDHMIIVDIGIIGRIHAETSLLAIVHIAFRNITCSST